MNIQEPDKVFDALSKQACAALGSFPLRPEYKDEQRDLQSHIAEVLRAAVPEGIEIITSTGAGAPKPSIYLYGTSFWPDVELRSQPGPLVGIEVKYVRSGQSASHAIAETLGQSLIYTIRYPAVIAFILHDGKYDPRLTGANDAEVRKRLQASGIELIVRRRETAAAAPLG